MKKNEGIFLGVSLMTTDFYSKARIKAYAKWSLAKFERFLVVIADVPEEINWVVLKGVKKEDAKLKIIYRTESLRKGYLRALGGLQGAIVLSVSEISNKEKYGEIYSIIFDEYKTNIKFQKDVDATVSNNLSGLLASISASNDIIKSLAPYVLHEFSVSIFLKWYNKPSFSIQISPRPDQLMENVLSGRSSATIKRIGIKPEPYEYLTKVLKEV